MRTDRDAMRLSVGLVTGNYFEVMGLSPILGRVTRPSDDGPGVAPVMILTHDFWQRRFRGDSSIVGKIVTVDGKSAQVIGVLQAAPFFPQRMDVLMNMVISPHHIGAGDAAGSAASDDGGRRAHGAGSDVRASESRVGDGVRAPRERVSGRLRPRVSLSRRYDSVQEGTRQDAQAHAVAVDGRGRRSYSSSRWRTLPT
jgi:hypothetical protein